MEDKDSQDRINNLKGIKTEAMGLVPRLNSGNLKAAGATMPEYIASVNRFYGMSKQNMAPEQYDQARKDFEYFMRLVELRYCMRKWRRG